MRHPVHIVVREIVLQRKNSFISSRATTDRRRIILVAVNDDNGLTGWGECSAPEEPRYCEEWTTSAWTFVNEVFIPSLLKRGYRGLESLDNLASVFRGNRMAKAAVECAFWDLNARQQGIPLWQLLGGTAQPVPCGVAIGIMESIDSLLEAVRKEMAAGYQRIKLKIKHGWDVHVVEAIRKEFPHIVLMVDANGAYNSGDLKHLAQLDRFGLLMIEQPFPPDDLWAFRQARDHLRTPICLDESVVSVASAQAALALQLCSIVNIKLGRVGGHTVGRQIVQLCTSSALPCWCGGQHEAGIGRAHSLAMATLMPRTLPAELSASTRYWHEDIIQPGIIVTGDGYIVPPQAAGLGYLINEELITHATVRLEEHRVL